MIREFLVRFYVASSTGIRLLSGVTVFIFTARFLGPTQFSIFATALALGSVGSLFSDFGLPMQMLRQVSSEPEKWRFFLSQSVALKLILSIAIGIFALVAIEFTSLSGGEKVSSLLLFFSVLIASFGDLFYVVLRAIGRYSIEATAVLWSSLISLALLAAVSAFTGDLIFTSLAFFASRIFHLVISLSVLGSLSDIRWEGAFWVDLRRFFSCSFSLFFSSRGYAADSILSNLSSQLDLILVPLVLSAGEAGVYQAGSRMVQVIAPIGMILGTIYVPKLARLAQSGDRMAFLAVSDWASFEFFCFGAVIFFGIERIVAPWSSSIFGGGYETLQTIWPSFAALTLLRFGVSGYAVRLMATGQMFYKVVSQLVYCIVFSVLFFLFKDRSDAVIFSLFAVISAGISGGTLAFAFVFGGFRLRDHVSFLASVILVLFYLIVLQPR